MLIPSSVEFDAGWASQSPQLASAERVNTPCNKTTATTIKQPRQAQRKIAMHEGQAFVFVSANWLDRLANIDANQQDRRQKGY